MLVEIFLDDAVLQHAAEREREAARRPGQPLGHDKVGGEHQHGAERERREAAAETASGMRRRSIRQTHAAAATSASSTASVALWVAAETAIKHDQADTLARGCSASPRISSR